jgi:hypothetical protein
MPDWFDRKGWEPVEVVFRWSDHSHSDEREVGYGSLDAHPTTLVHRGRRFHFVGWELASRSGERNRLRLVYRR